MGFVGFSDPCPGGPAVVCDLPSAYAIATPTISSIDSDTKLITVHVTGAADLTLITRVANYL